MLLKPSLHERMNVMRVGVKALTFPPPQQSNKSLPCFNHEGIILRSYTLQSITNYTRAPWRELTPRIQMSQLYTLPISVHLFNESPVRPSGQCSHHSSTDIRNPVCGTARFYHQNATTSITTTHLHPAQNNYPHILIIWHGTMIQLPPRTTFQQHHWMTQSGLKIKSQIDICASMRHLSSQTTSVSTLAHTETQPSGQTYHNLHCKIQQYFAMS